MTWGYRIVRYFDRRKGFGVHEVFYDDQGKPTAMTAEACGFYCDEDEDPQVIVDSLRRAIHDAESKPVFDEPEAWANQVWREGEIIGRAGRRPEPVDPK